MKKHLVFAAAIVATEMRLATAVAQQPATTSGAAAKAESYSGCVTAIPQVQGAFVLASEKRSLLLQGKYDAAAIAKHKVVAKGRVTDAADLDPDTLHIEAISSIGAECSHTCTLEPPGTRSLHKPNKENPGKEGATQGLHDDPPPHR